MLCKRLLGLSIFALLLVCSTSVLAQTRVVSGKVTDSKDGSPVVGASVQVRGSTVGTITGADGTFSLSVPAGTTALEISSVGFTAQTVTLTGSDEINVSLQASAAAENLNEVVVIGYGTARKRDLTGAVASVSAKDFNKGVVTSPDQLLQNKVAGLEVTNNSGQPGAATTVKIRGNNSIRAVNNPLYVIDGVPLDGRSARPNLGTVFGSMPDANPLLFVNPNDIERVEILKDAASAAIYGSRGANGVIAISTKTGTAGPVKLEFGSNWTANTGLMKKFGILDASEFKSALTKYGVSDQDKGANVDAFKEVANKKLSQNYNLALSAGNDNGRFRASFLASKLQGYFKGSELGKYVGTFSGNYAFFDKRLSIGFNLTAGQTKENILPVSNTAGSAGNLISSLLQWNPTSAFIDASGNFINPTNGSGNPLALIAATNDIAKVNSILGNITAGYKILDNLEYRLMYAINNSNGERNTNYYGFLKGQSGLSGLGFGAVSAASLNSQTLTHTLNYNSTLSDKLSLNAVAGYEYWKSDYTYNLFSASGFNTNQDEHNITIPYTSMLQNGSTQNLPVTYVDPKNELQSVFARAILNFADRYILSGTMRADGSSKFGKNNKYGYFPSVGFRWAISNEDFMKHNNLFSNLAFRASWGITGNQEFPAGAAQEQFYFSQYNTVGQTNVANPDLKWEQTQSYNFGLDFGISTGKLTGSIDYYHKNTSDILFQSTAIQPAPASISFVNLPANLVNSGIELNLGTTLISTPDVIWSLNGYYSYNKNLLKNFTQNGQNVQILTGQINGQGVSGTLGQIITNGYPVNEYYLKEFGGFDASGNQIIGETPIFAGDPNPVHGYGVSTTVNYKKLTFVLNGGGAAGYMIYNNTATSVTNISGIANGRNIDKKAYNSSEKPTSPVGASTRFLEKGDFFKLRNAGLTYNVGDLWNVFKNVNFFIVGNNLVVLTKFSGFDPEVNIDKSNSGYPSRSIEYIPYPTPRTITVGFNLSL